MRWRGLPTQDVRVTVPSIDEEDNNPMLPCASCFSKNAHGQKHFRRPVEISSETRRLARACSSPAPPNCPAHKTVAAERTVVLQFCSTSLVCMRYVSTRARLVRAPSSICKCSMKLPKQVLLLRSSRKWMVGCPLTPNYPSYSQPF